MNSKKYTKQEVAEALAKKGYKEDEALKIWEDVCETIFTCMVAGGVVNIIGVGKLTGGVLPAGEIEMFGEEKKVSERLQIKFVKSRTADNRFKSTYSTEAQKRNKLKDIAKLLSK